MTRAERVETAQEVLRILEAGGWDGPDGRVDIRGAIDAAVGGTLLHRAEEALPTNFDSRFDTAIEVANESTLRAARRLTEAGHRTVALNFANALIPGGGFLIGANAQEEDLARASALFACIVDSPMYEENRRRCHPLDSHHMTYAPDVPVFRDERGNLTPRVWTCSFITAPAVNAGSVRHGHSDRVDEILPTLRERALRVLSVAALHGHDAIVLGAWGCGAFQNDPREVAAIFREALHGPFCGVFARVAFAVLDEPGSPAITAFRDAFAGDASPPTTRSEGEGSPAI